MEKFINEQLQETFLLKVFGEPYSVVNLDASKDTSLTIKQLGQNPTLVKVMGMKAAGACVKLDKPKFILLPGNGEKADDCGFEDDDKVKMWTVDKDFSSVALQISPVSIADLGGDKAIDSISLSVKIKNPSYSGGVISATIEIKVSVFGLRITENLPIQGRVPLGGTVEVYNGNISGFDVVIEAALKTLNKVCVEASVSYGIFSANESVCKEF